MIKIIFSLILITSSLLYSQERGPGGGMGGNISGRVLDAGSSHPVEYANIVVYKESDSSQVTGTVSNPEGRFTIDRIPPGRYYVEVLFIGYTRERLNGIQLGRGNLSADLGDILIKPSAINLGDVVIEQDRPSLTYQIDKKVINVDQMGATISGNAADVLENIPSVSVDIEGNVSIRGSSNFTVLIDGRPTIVDAQDVLQQTPASTIENIEIITNPSAKYNPEGTSGIINIILKKNSASGLSGIVNASAGLNDKYGGDFLFQYKTPLLNTNFGFDYNDRSFSGNDDNINRYIYQGNTTTIRSYGDTRRGRESLGLRGSAEFNLGKNNFVTLGGRFNDRQMNRDADFLYDQSSDTSAQPSLSRNKNLTERKGNSYSLNLNYLNKFTLPGHELSADLVFNRQKSEASSVSEIFNGQELISGKRTTEDGPSREINGRIDYVLPVGGKNRLEAGYQGEIDISDEESSLYDYNRSAGIYENQYIHNVRYEENEHAVYSTYSGSVNDFGYQVGLRGEYTHRIISLLSTEDEINPALDPLYNKSEFTINRWDYFPTIHTSYQFSPGSQLMASYTRRINRPRGWALEPFLTWFNANTVRTGNPALLPEFIDSYEVGGQTYFGKLSVTSEVYYLKTNNKIEGIRSLYSEDVTLQTFANVGSDRSIGTELMLGFDVAKIWSINLMGNLYDYRIEGVLDDGAFSRSSFNWRSRINNVIKLGANTQFQFNVMYHSPSVSSQGRRESFITSDAAVRQDFLDKKLTLTFQVRDLFGSTLHKFTSEGPGFYSAVSMKRESPVVMLNLRWNINSFKQERRQPRNEEGFMEGEEL